MYGIANLGKWTISD